MEIDDYFETEKGKDTVVLIDFNNSAHRSIFGAHNKYMQDVANPNMQMNPEDLYDIWRNYMIQNFFDYVKEFKPDKLIIAVDSKSWRKTIYADYKGGRDAQRAKSAIDFTEFYPIMNKLVEDLKTLIPNAYVLKVSDCEVDDIIAVLSKTVFKDDNVIIISGDGDFEQLLQYSNVRIYNPDGKVKAFVQSLDPKGELNLKVVVGDGGNGQGDNIPNILVMPSEYVFEGNTIGCGDATAQKVLENGLDSEYVIQKVASKYNSFLETKKQKKIYDFDKISKEKIVEIVKLNYERNLKLISFEQIPIDIQKKIIAAYESYTLGKYNSMAAFTWLLENKIRKVAENLQPYSMFLKTLH